MSNKLVALRQPISLDSVDGVARFSMLAANETAALLECAPWMRAPSPGLRLSLLGREGFLKAVRFQLTVTDVVDSQKVVATFNTISASHRADYLSQVLEHVMGLKQRIAGGVDALPAGTEVVWDAQRRLVRTRAGNKTTSDLSAPSSPTRRADEDGYYASSADLEAMRAPTTDEEEPVLEVSERSVSRLHPIYPIPACRGFYVDGEDEDLFMVVMTAVGSSHCIFETPRWTAPTLGTVLRVGVPLAPIGSGLTWIPAKVSQVSGLAPQSRVAGARARIEVAVDRYSSEMPPEFGQLVGHLSRSTAP